MTGPEELPYGELGDLMESLVPIATNLVHAMRDEGPNAVLGALLQLRSVEAGLSPKVREKLQRLPNGLPDALTMVCAAMVNPDARMRALLGWTDELIDGAGAERVIAERIADSAARERARLTAAGVRDPAVLAPPVGAAQLTTKDRMLHVVQGGRESA